MQVSTAEFKNGLKVELDGEPFVMIYFQHVKPGKGGAFVRTKLKNLRTGRVTSTAPSAPGDSLEESRRRRAARCSTSTRTASSYVFMDTESYEQIPFSSGAESATRAPISRRTSTST